MLAASFKVHLICQYFRPAHPAVDRRGIGYELLPGTVTAESRQAEIDECLRRNIANPLLSVHTLNEIAYGLQGVTEVVIHKRLHYLDAFRYANSECVGDWVIVANADLYYDASLHRLLPLNAHKLFLALSRHEATDRGTVFAGHRAGQDAWMFVPPVPLDHTDFPLGAPGCDPRIARVMVDHGYTVINPAYSIICHHLHNTHYRNYVHNHIVGAYALTEPSTLEQPITAILRG